MLALKAHVPKWQTTCPPTLHWSKQVAWPVLSSPGRGGIFLLLGGIPRDGNRIFNKLGIQSIIIDFPNFSSACRQCLYQESWQGVSGMGREGNNVEVIANPHRLECALFCSQLGPLYLAQCLEHERCSVNICWLQGQLHSTLFMWPSAK